MGGLEDKGAGEEGENLGEGAHVCEGSKVERSGVFHVRET